MRQKISYIMQGYNEESARLAAIAIKRLKSAKMAIEYYDARDKFDEDELQFVITIENNWHKLTDLQKQVTFMHLIQGFSFTSISEYAGTSPQAVWQAWRRACKWFKMG